MIACSVGADVRPERAGAVHRRGVQLGAGRDSRGGRQPARAADQRGHRRRRVPEPEPRQPRRLLAHRRHLALGRVPAVRRARRRLRDGRGRGPGGAQAPRGRAARRRPHLRGAARHRLQQRRPRRRADDAAPRGPARRDVEARTPTSTSPSRPSATSRRTAPPPPSATWSRWARSSTSSTSRPARASPSRTAALGSIKGNIGHTMSRRGRRGLHEDVPGAVPPHDSAAARSATS